MPTSSSSAPDSSSFHLLDTRIQRWIWQEGWSELKDIQEDAIPALLAADRDVIIAAATASGKTEAAFLPILSHLLQAPAPGCVLYVSPLKALINDQWGRLSRLCEELKIPVLPWHGDISSHRKKQFFEKPEGVVLITPESVEGFLMSRGHGLQTLLGNLQYWVLDEAHAFIGTERGKQVQSQFARVDTVLGRFVPRVGLSATLGDMHLAAEFLRPGKGAEVELIVSREASQGLKILVKGYVSKSMAIEEAMALSTDAEEVPTEAETQLMADLFTALRGAHNLVFPNSRRDVERYTDQLNKLCDKLGVPHEFWPHHGSLGKSVREESEAALKAHDQPATAICTTTLELGIDIGDVKSIAQIGAAPSVASLRQRLGRSGRRKGESSILRCFCIEEELSPRSTLSEELRTGLIENIAMIELLLQNWYEPPRINGMHLSTLIQQLLSVIGQYGGVTIGKAWELLFETGSFGNVTKAEFVELVRHLGERKILMQESSGLLLHGAIGEKLVNHFGFYAAFSAEEAYRLVSEKGQLGALPISRPLDVGSYVIYAGRRWKVLSVDTQKKVIQVKADAGGKAPWFAGDDWFKRHDRIREMMREVLASDKDVMYLDSTARVLLKEARQNYRQWGLDTSRLVQTGTSFCLFPWAGDWVMDTLTLMLHAREVTVSNEKLYLEIKGQTSASLQALLEDLASAPLSAEALAALVRTKVMEKWDALLPEDLLCKNYAAHHLDVAGAQRFLRDFLKHG